MGYGALSAADYFDSPGYTANPNVRAFKWGRNGWNIATTPTYLNTNPVGSSAIATPGPYSITNQYVNTTGTCTGSTATSAGVSGLVGCVGFQTISQGASSGMANWTTTTLDASYRPVDVRTTVPSTQYIYNHTPAAYSFNIPFQSLFSSAGSYANLQTLDQTFTGGTPAQKYVFYNRSQVTGLMAGMGARMLGYDGLSMSSGLKGWNGSYGEGNLGNAVNCPGCALFTGQTAGAMYGGTISTLHTLNSGLSLAPTMTAGPSAINITTTTATITWTTNYPATTMINDKATYNDTILDTSHSATLNGLTPSTTYTVNAISYDCVANKAVSSVTFTTASACTPTGSEICDGLDNDCNGSIDDGLTRATACGTGECASTGTETCVAGTWSNDTCTPGTSTTEVCDELDNDCDGQTDEGIASTATTCGVGECASTGTLSCVAGSMVDSCVADSPTAEVCNGLDDDCDGAADDGIASTTTTCGVGQCASTGTLSCVAGVMVDSCATGSPTTEGPPGDATCQDGLDNDCDGVTDASDSDCVQACVPAAEVCNGLDDDCDGAVDEGIASTSTTCGVGACASTGTLSCVA
ncbi:MAG: MopE-related protein, partial [Nitrospirota bacterium]